MKKTTLFLGSVMFLATTLSSCSDKKQNETTNTEIVSERPENPEDSSQNLILESNDQMQFLQKEFKVKAGEPVTLTLRHIGKMAKEVMGHNFVLLKSDTDVSAFAEKAARENDNEYIPADDADIIAHTKLIGGGEEDTIVFTIEEAGIYPFICSFPGHAGLMKGKIIAE